MGTTVGTGVLLLARESFQGVPRVFGSVQVPQTPLDGGGIQKFVTALPTFVGNRVTATSFTARVQEFSQQILPGYPPTVLWGYKVDDKPVSYPGFTVEAHRHRSTTITYMNELPDFAHSRLEPLLTIDQTVHWADPLKQMSPTNTDPYTGPIPTVTHLHGGEIPSEFDGGPTQWFTRTGIHGSGYAALRPAARNSAIYQYPNSQEATTLLFHDHALGATRINVYAGLLTVYFIRDEFDTGLAGNPLRLPNGNQEIELVIQDRQFDTNGQLLFPDGHPPGLSGPPPDPNLHPYWIPGFLGDVIVVNGKSWPFLEVEPRRYRFRFLNGANARFFKMHLTNSTTSGGSVPFFWQIGTDGGLLDQPVQLNDPNSTSKTVFIAPGERADTILDFAGFAGQNFILVNDAPAPYPNGLTGTLDPHTNGQIMQFRVKDMPPLADTSYNPASDGALRGGQNREPLIIRLVNPQTGTLADGVTPSVKRQLVLVEKIDQKTMIPLEFLLNNTKWSGRREIPPNRPVPGSQPTTMGQGYFMTELPQVGATEVWEVLNLAEEAHPIHIHLIQFQIMNRQDFRLKDYRAKYDSSFQGGKYLPGDGPPLLYTKPNEAGAVGGNPDVTPFLSGTATPPEDNETGWKDTVKMLPGQVTRIVARWAPQDVQVKDVEPGENRYPFDPTSGPGYAWHCHMLDHEDNEMMRPYSPVRRSQ